MMWRLRQTRNLFVMWAGCMIFGRALAEQDPRLIILCQQKKTAQAWLDAKGDVEQAT
jgi:hypothetical protein